MESQKILIGRINSENKIGTLMPKNILFLMKYFYVKVNLECPIFLNQTLLKGLQDTQIDYLKNLLK